MTTPSILPVVAAAPKAGSASTPAGGGAGRDFASLIAGLVAGPVSADATEPAGEKAADGGSSEEADAGPATSADLAATAISTPAVAALVPLGGRAGVAASSVPTAADLALGTVTVASPPPATDALPRAVEIPGQTKLANVGTIPADIARTTAAPPPAAPPAAPGRSDVPAVAGVAGGMDHALGAPAGVPVAPPSAARPVRATVPEAAADSRGGGVPDLPATVGGAPVTPTTPAASTAQTPAPPPAATAAQLVAPIAAVRFRGPDGTHSLTVDITPDELGPVRIHVELRDGNVELRLAGHSEAARDALRAALPDLRRALEAAGVGTGSFQIAPDTSGQPRDQQSQPQFGQPQHSQPQHSDNPQNGHARPAWAGPDGRAQHQPEPEPAPMARPVGSLDLQL